MSLFNHQSSIINHQSKDFYELALDQIAELKVARPELEKALEYYEAVLQLQSEVSSSFQPNLDCLDIGLCKERNSEGLPFLKAEDVKIDWTLFDSLFRRISQISQQYGTEVTWQRVSDCFFREDRSQIMLLKGILEDKSLLGELADEIGIDRNIFIFLTWQTFIPFLETWAEKLRENLDLSSWLEGFCPVCGGEPFMARLDKQSGKRYLQCHLCRSEWIFRRIECPFCGNKDQDTLRFFYIEDDEVYRVEVCDQCKAYLKTVDARNTEETRVLFVEDLVTTHLDIIAKREGFLRCTNSLFNL